MKKEPYFEIVQHTKQQVIELTCRIIQTHPIYGGASQEKAQLLLKQYLDENGFKTELDWFYYADIEKSEPVQHPWEFSEIYKDYRSIGKLNLYGILDSGKKGPLLILNGHIDVDIVSDPHRWSEVDGFCSGSVREGKIRGRGATDMLTGLCSLATIGQILKQIEWRGKVIFSSVVDEEIGGNGSIRFLQWLKAGSHIADYADYANCEDAQIEAIIAEPTGCRFNNRSMSFLPFTIDVKNLARHMNMIKKEENLLIKLEKLLQQLKSIAFKNPEFRINIGVIDGGTESSLPIENLEIQGVITFPPPYELRDVKADMQRIFDSPDTAITFPGLIIPPSVSDRGFFSQFVPNHDRLFESSCNAFVFAAHHIPFIVFGPGELRMAHATDEYIETDAIEEYLLKLYGIIGAFYEHYV